METETDKIKNEPPEILQPCGSSGPAGTVFYTLFYLLVAIALLTGFVFLTGVGRVGAWPVGRSLVYHAANAWGGYLDNRWNQRLLSEKYYSKGINLPNFRKIDEGIFAGGQPSAPGLLELKGLYAVKTVINLRFENKRSAEIEKEAGLRVIYLPVKDTSIPDEKQTAELKAVLADLSLRPVYIHCAAGSNRTGTVVGMYRLIKGAGIGEVLAELSSHGWNPAWLHSSDEKKWLERIFAEIQVPK
jgi:protein tyrosine phosphatase (PTP) superfamily phosphohydrolase (DUF442 family)